MGGPRVPKGFLSLHHVSPRGRLRFAGWLSRVSADAFLPFQLLENLVTPHLHLKHAAACRSTVNFSWGPLVLTSYNPKPYPCLPSHKACERDWCQHSVDILQWSLNGEDVADDTM